MIDSAWLVNPPLIFLDSGLSLGMVLHAKANKIRNLFVIRVHVEGFTSAVGFSLMPRIFIILKRSLHYIKPCRLMMLHQSMILTIRIATRTVPLLSSSYASPSSSFLLFVLYFKKKEESNSSFFWSELPSSTNLIDRSFVMFYFYFINSISIFNKYNGSTPYPNV